MPIDGLLLNKLIREAQIFEGEKIRNIYQPVNDEVLLQLQSGFLLFVLKNPSYLIKLESKPNMPDTPQNFSMFLRKKIKNAKIIKIEQLGLDRIGYIELSVIDETFELRNYKLYFELMGRNSNILLIDEENKIMDALKKGVSPKRSIMPGAKYIPFYKREYINILENENLYDLNQPFMGFSKISKNLFYEYIEKYDYISFVSEFLDNLNVYTFEYNGKKEILAFKPVNFKYDEFQNPSEGLLNFFELQSMNSRFLELKKRLEKTVIKEIEKYERLYKKLKNEEKEIREIPDLEKKGRLLQAYLYQFKEKTDFVVVEDWETGEKIKINLNPLKTPNENLQVIFKKVHKLKSKEIHLKERIKITKKMIDYLYQLWQSIDFVEDIETLMEIKEEMIQEKILQDKTKNKRRKRSNSKPYEFEFNGFKIFVGKNNIQNDKITREADREDIWMHAQGIPGAHVIIKTNKKEVPMEVLLFGAKLAAKYSKGRYSSKVSIDYTMKKYVWKPKGSKPGMVLYNNFKTLYVEPI
ncbi:Rqc2 family fibronectin-binding protein [Marinitoga sp. 1155]|uniref:Rqc2 family fibronectin-binding protein n=1 Tax=Marinitoga sp. 1155 TaxID=1428448 RepID=UPI00065A0EF9|nr:NFACT family protein [Marinitoga sp. 1155]KLO20925.1 fibronectin-binding protein [Marinitoga sp. 1155]